MPSDEQIRKMLTEISRLWREVQLLQDRVSTLELLQPKPEPVASMEGGKNASG